MNFKPINLASEKKVLFCSDIHYNHVPSWHPAPYESRGFKTIQEYNEWFLASWFKYVDSETVVINLGDAFLNSKPEEFLEFTKLPCKKQLYVFGNHESPSKSVYLDAVKNQYGIGDKMVFPLQVNNLVFVGESLWFAKDSISVWCQHFAPYIWPEMAKNGMAICGHSHSTCKGLNPSETKFGKILDCGVDNAIMYNSTPFFSWEEICKIMENKPVVKKDHH